MSREKAEFASQLQENEEELQVGYKGVIMFTRVFCVRKRLLCTQEVILSLGVIVYTRG